MTWAPPMASEALLFLAAKPKEVSYVVARKHKAQQRSQRPAGVKGQYKQVGPRIK